MGSKHFVTVGILLALELDEEMFPRPTRQEVKLNFQNKQELVEDQQRQAWEFYFVPGTNVSSSLDKTCLLPLPKGKIGVCSEKYPHNRRRWVLWSCLFVEELSAGTSLLFSTVVVKARKTEMLTSHNSLPLCALDFLELYQETVWGNLFNLYLISWFCKNSWDLRFLSS